MLVECKGSVKDKIRLLKKGDGTAESVCYIFWRIIFQFLT